MKLRGGSIIASWGVAQECSRSSVRHFAQRRIHRSLAFRIAMKTTLPFHHALAMGRQDGLGVIRDVASWTLQATPL